MKFIRNDQGYQIVPKLLGFKSENIKPPWKG